MFFGESELPCPDGMPHCPSWTLASLLQELSTHQSTHFDMWLELPHYSYGGGVKIQEEDIFPLDCVIAMFL